MQQSLWVNEAIKKELAHKRTTLQAVSLEVYMAGKRKRTICLIYLPPTDLVTEILLRDFNLHNPLRENEKNEHQRENARENP